MVSKSLNNNLFLVDAAGSEEATVAREYALTRGDLEKDSVYMRQKVTGPHGGKGHSSYW
ncbi:hypothetical protein [Cesiribacter sp. SM1]|uniref:hypothetical protein n=1 Tax=Cesiribacter sp. SM1 TaxID=2861196 RepID=UPI001CD75FFE|nr:hypothetical protein [Cesiribacter sp. SM1]